MLATSRAWLAAAVLFACLAVTAPAYGGAFGYQTALGTYGSGPGQFYSPGGMAVAGDYLYVADAGNTRIQKIDIVGPTYDAPYQWGSWATLDWPTDLAVVGSSVYVMDEGAGEIVKYSTSGAFQASWETTYDGSWFTPSGIAVTAGGTHVYVSDSYEGRIIDFGSNGATSTLYKSGLHQPTGLAIDSAGALYALEVADGHIAKWNSEGVAQPDIGIGDGQGDGSLSGAQALAIAASGPIWVADTNNDRIQEFSAAGAFLGKWGIYGSTGLLWEPEGIAVDNGGRVFIADTGNDRVLIYGPDAQEPVNRSAPSIGGTAQPDAELECTPGSWDGSPDFTFTWLRNGVPVSEDEDAYYGAWRQWYYPSSSDVGAALVCRVSGINSTGITVSADSPSVTVTAYTMPSPSPVPVPAPAPPAPTPAPVVEPAGPPTVSRVTVHKAYRYATISKSGLRVTLSTNKSGVVTGELVVPKKAFKKLKVKMPKRGVVGAITVKRSAPGFAELFIRWNATGKKLAKAAIKRKYVIKAKVCVHAHDKTGAKSKELEKTVTLTTKASA